MKKKILIVVGTRPNFIKVTQFRKAAAAYPQLEFKIVHTGQHYDAKMADVFFEQFGLQPDFFLNITQGSANTQMAEIMVRLEELIVKEFRPDLLIVVGDVNSTFAAALTANKLNIKIAHLESGLRSFDKSMPEEHNRVLTDAITDWFFITEPSGTEHLLKEGKNKEQLFFVGNTMIDTMVAFDEEIRKSDITEQLKLGTSPYLLMTMHRPATVDSEQGLKQLIGLLEKVSSQFRIVFPVHPRTLKNIENMGLMKNFSENQNIILTGPLDYFAFQRLIIDAKLILTDSGGIQEESTFRKVPCLTLRPNTERPVTVTEGTNTLVPFDIPQIEGLIGQIVKGTYRKGTVPQFWDGRSTQRIVQIIAEKL